MGQKLPLHAPDCRLSLALKENPNDGGHEVLPGLFFGVQIQRGLRQNEAPQTFFSTCPASCSPQVKFSSFWKMNQNKIGPEKILIRSCIALTHICLYMGGSSAGEDTSKEVFRDPLTSSPDHLNDVGL